MRRRNLRTLDALRSFLRMAEPDWSAVNVLGLDLRPLDFDDALLKQEFAPSTSFLGCRMSAALGRKIISAGALLLPPRPSLPFNAFRNELYRAADLLKGYAPTDPETYLETPDWQCYLAAMDKVTKQKREDVGVDDAVFLRLH